MKIRQLTGALCLFLLFCFPAHSEVDPLQVWTASGGEARLELRADYLPDFGLEIVHEGRAAHDVVEVRRGFSESDHLIIEAPYGNFEGFVGGQIRLDTGWVLRHESNEVRLDGLTLTPGMYHNGHPSLEARDAAGRHLLTFHHIHILTDYEPGLLALHNMDFSGEAALAEMLGLEALDQQPLGQAWLDLNLYVPEGADTSGIGIDTSGRGLSCAGRPFWPQQGHEIDVGLIAIGQVSHQGTAGDGRIKVTPSATLKNLSEGDVPWIQKFTTLGGGHSYPYEPEDQHPFLVWNMYRIADGRIQQLAESGVKHAFLTTNFSCSINCGNSHILWPGCEDTYSVGNNESGPHLGPKDEIEASIGLWESCGSFFDPGCTGSNQNTSGSGQFENRLMVDPGQLQTPGAEYFLDSWYVIQYDINIFNTMGYHPITPTPAGNGWSFPTGPFTTGPVINQWVDPDNLGADEDYAAIVVPSATPNEPYPGNMPQGHINVMVKVTELQPGRYRYNYAVQNFDFDRGVEAFRVPINDSATVFETWFGGVDGEPGDDWIITVEDGFVNFQAPENNPLGWFKLFNFEIETNAPPTASEVTLDLGGDAVVPSWTEAILGPETGPVPIPGDVTLEQVFPEDTFNFPLALRHAGDGSGRMFVVERNGFIRIVDDQGDILPDPFLDISSQVDTFFEGGLLGLAFHPNFTANGKFYVNFTSSGLTTRIAEFEVDSTNPDLADPSSQLNILSIPQPAGNHNGGDIHFGPDGYLYIGMGDGGPSSHGQNLGTLLGSMLRIDIDGDDFPGDPDRNYAIPPDNPFVGVTGEDEIWSYGLRNPYRWSFDRDTGDLWIGDVGQSTWEEVNLQPAASTGGENYGWAVCEGNWQTGSTTTPCGLAGHTPPVLEYRRTSPHCSVTGGYRYRGPFPSLQGWYIYGDYCSGRVWLAQESGGEWLADEFDNVGFGIVGFGEDEAGHLYLLRSNGQILRFEGSEGPPPAGELEVDPLSLDFGQVLIGDSGELPVTLSNAAAAGAAALELTQIEVIDGAPEFEIADNDCGATLPAQASCTVAVQFTPPAETGYDGVLRIAAAGKPVVNVSLAGQGTEQAVPVLSLSTDALAFGAVQAGEQASLDVALGNTGTAALEVGGLELPAAPFSVDTNDCGGSEFELAPGDNCTLTVTFAPPGAGEFDDELAIESNAASSPDTVVLSGTGTPGPVEPGVLEVTPMDLDFGQVPAGGEAILPVTISNTAPEGAAALPLTQIEVISGNHFTIVANDCGPTLPASDSCTVQVRFGPNEEVAYSGVLRVATNGQSANVTLAGHGGAQDPAIFEDRFELTMLLNGWRASL